MPQQQRKEGLLWLQRPAAASTQKKKWERLQASLTPAAVADGEPYPCLRCPSQQASSSPLELTIVQSGSIEPVTTPTPSSSSSWLLGGAFRRPGAAPTAAPAVAVTVEALDTAEWAKARQYGRTPAPPRRYRLGFASREEAEAWRAVLLLPAPTDQGAAPPPLPSATALAPLPTAPALAPAPALDLPPPPATSATASDCDSGGGAQGATLEARLERLHLADYESRLNGLRVRRAGA